MNAWVTGTGVASAVLGAAFLGVWVTRLHAVGALHRLSRRRFEGVGLTDYLVYGYSVAPGVVLGKDGSLLAAWSYRGLDAESANDTEQARVADAVNRAFARLGDGWMVHVDAVRAPSPGYPSPDRSHFTDTVTAAIDDERREYFAAGGTLFDTTYRVTLTYQSPSVASAELSRLAVDDGQGLGAKLGRILRAWRGQAPSPTDDRSASPPDALSVFAAECAAFESGLSSVFTLTRLTAEATVDADGTPQLVDDSVSWYHECVTGQALRLRLPHHGCDIDQLVGGVELGVGQRPRVGRDAIAVVTIDGFPAQSTPAMLTALSQLPCAYRWSTRFIAEHPTTAKTTLATLRRGWRAKERGFKDLVLNKGQGAPNADAVAVGQEAEAMVAELDQGVCRYGWYTTAVVLRHPDSAVLDRAALGIQDVLAQLGFAGRIETVNTLEAFLGSLPGHGVYNVRKPYLSTRNVADLLPTSAMWLGAHTAPCDQYPPHTPALMRVVAVGDTPFDLNLHCGDIGHSLMVGPTGAGKSVHLALIAAQLRRTAHMRVYCFDKGRSMYALTQAIWAGSGGQTGHHFDIAADDEPLAFAPLSFLATDADLARAIEWVEIAVGLQLAPRALTLAQRADITDALTARRDLDRAGSDAGPPSTNWLFDRLTDITLKESLRPYLIDDPRGKILAANEDGLALSDFMCFEMDTLLSLGERVVLPVLSYLFNRIERSLDGRPTAILIDEAWLALGHPVFAQKIKGWLHELRKYNCLVLMATQSIAQLAESSLFPALRSETATRIFLPNLDARSEEGGALYRRFDLNPTQIELIAAGRYKRDYYLVSRDGQRAYELALGPLALAFCAASSPTAIARIQALIGTHGHQWPQAWLNERAPGQRVPASL